MRKTLALLLTMLMLCAPAAIIAEYETTVDITFDGEYYELEEYGFQIYLPSEWVVEDVNEESFFAYNGEMGHYMEILFLDADGTPLRDIAAEIAQEAGYLITEVTVNGLDFVFFEVPGEEAFGAFANSPDDSVCYWFMFCPLGDAEFEALALQIMASIQNT